MTTLTTTALPPMLDHLFKEAAAASPATSPAVADLLDDRERLMRSKTDYLHFRARLKDFPLSVSRETGALPSMPARGAKGQSIVGFGSSFGIATLHLAAALRDNGAQAHHLRVRGSKGAPRTRNLNRLRSHRPWLIDVHAARAATP